MKRRVVIAGAVAGALAAAGANWRSLWRKHYPPTPYDDVLGQVIDRDAAAALGRIALPAMPGFTPANGAARLRSALGSRGLAAAAQDDARAGRVIEADGWILPQSVALMAALAAKV